MNILEFADVINRQVKITYYPNQDGRFSASFESGDVVRGSCLVGLYGNGKSAIEAINDYSGRIAGQELAFPPSNCDRVRVPKKLELLK